MNSSRSRRGRVPNGSGVSDLRGRRCSSRHRDSGRARRRSGNHAVTSPGLRDGLPGRLASRSSLRGGRSLRDSGGRRGQLAVGAPTGQVAGCHGSSAGVERATGLGGLGGRTATAAIDEVANLAGVWHVPDHAGLVPLIVGGGRDAAAEICAGRCEAGKAEENGQGEGLHVRELYETNGRCRMQLTSDHS